MIWVFLFFCLKYNGSNIMFCLSESSQLNKYIGTAAVEMLIIIIVLLRQYKWLVLLDVHHEVGCNHCTTTYTKFPSLDDLGL